MIYKAECDNLDIRGYLQEKGPSLSSSIKNELFKEGITDEAARQQISRARGGIYRLEGIQFPKQEKFIYLKDQYKTPSFYINLVKAFKATSSIHKCIITGLNNFGGRLSIDKLKVISGCPQARKKKKTFDQVTNELVKHGLIFNDNTIYYLNEDIFSSAKIYKDNRVTNYLNDFLREILALWLKNNSLVSYNAISFNGDFCSYCWDIVAPSYLLPLIKKDEGRINPGFIVADIIPQYEIDNEDVDYFIRKVDSSFLGKKTRPFIPILLGYRFNDSAWELLRKRNILAATINNFFGEEIEKLLINVAKLLETKNIKESDNLGDISNILKAVSKIEGPTNNFRGHFFELIVGFIASKTYAGSVSLNKKIKNDTDRVEIDVLMTTSNEIIVYECKAKNPSQLIAKEEIIEWKKNVAFIYRYFKSDSENSNRHISFYFCTTSDFNDEAKDEFNKINSTRYKMKIINGSEVFNFAKDKNLEDICAILKQYFIR